MNREFTHRNLLTIFPDLKDRSMISWSERRLIKPSQDASGRGSARSYSYTNVMEIGIIRELSKYGISFSKIKSVMENGELMKILNEEMWNTIFWISAEKKEGFYKHLPDISFGVISFDDFLDRGGKLLITTKDIQHTNENSSEEDTKETDAILYKTSAIVININSLKRHVDHMIKKL